MSLVTDPTFHPPSTAHHTPTLSSPPTPTLQPSPPLQQQRHPHRRLYNRQTTATTTTSNNLSFNQPPLMLLPKARLHEDNDDDFLHHHRHHRHRPYTVVPENGVEKLQLSAISATSGWMGEDGEGGRGRGMLGGHGGRRPLTAFDLNARRRKEERREMARSSAEAGPEDDCFELEESRPRTAHPLMTRRGKMALLRQHDKRHHHHPLSERSVSADSGLGFSPSTTLDKATRDVSSSDIFEDVTRFSSNENVAAAHHSSLSSSGGGGGFFAAYINRHSLAHDDKMYEPAGNASGAAANPSDVDSALLTSDDALPEHLDSFEDVAEALVGRLRRSKRRSGKDGDDDDVFDEKWHGGHLDGEDCPFCREFERATKRRVDRYFGGAESFLKWIFSKWGKRKEVEGSFRRGVGVRGRSPHFCNFVHKVDLHARLDATHARTGSGNDGGEDGRDSLLSDGTDNDVLAQWRKSRLSNSGTEGRPGSPSSLDGRQGKGSRDPTAAGAASGDEDAMSAKLIPTITIPSSPIPPRDQMLSNRSSGESSPRKSVRGEEPAKLPESSPEKSPTPRPLSASRPPPTPPSKEKEKEKPEKNKRLPISKKTKKSVSEKRRKAKTGSGMEPAPPGETPASVQLPASGDGEAQAATNGLDVTAEVPDLPGLSSSGKKHGRRGRKSERRLITPPPGVGEKLHLPPELLDLDSNSRSGYDFTDLETTLSENSNNKYRPQNWLNSRMALSQQASRFELPMDMKVLEKITPQEYLKKFCIITSRRLNLYQKIFMKHKEKSNTINKKGLETCLKETLVQQLKDDTFIELCDLLDITDNTVIDFKLFSGCAAITERILYPCYTTEDTLEKPEYQREKIETADFGALDWKLHGIQVGEKMRRLLKTIE